MPFSIFQPASVGLLEPPPRAGPVQPVKSLPLKSGFDGSADCSDAMSTKQRSMTPTEMPFTVNPPALIFRRRRAWFTDRNFLFAAVRFIRGIGIKLHGSEPA